MRFSEASGHKVVSTATATTVGRLEAFIVDPPAHQVVGLSLKKTLGAGDTLPWPDIASFGTDAVTVVDDAVVVVPDAALKELGDRRHTITGKRMLDQSGVDLGKVIDVDFDPADGIVRALLTDREEVPGDRLVAVGSYAVVVTAAS